MTDDGFEAIADIKDIQVPESDLASFSSGLIPRGDFSLTGHFIKEPLPTVGGSVLDFLAHAKKGQRIRVNVPYSATHDLVIYARVTSKRKERKT